MFKINESIKITSVKPSGTISLLAGATPGVHYPIANHYIRRVRLSKNDELVEKYRNLGYYIENDVVIKDNVVIEFPIEMKDIKVDPSVEDQLELASLMQCYWADNQVSCTVTIDKNIDLKYLNSLIMKYQNKLKAISFLPKTENNYKQLPYEKISEEEYVKLIKKRKITYSFDNNKKKSRKLNVEQNHYCDSEMCMAI
jgi:ribonucleotide reductase alpha subunit